MEYRKGSVRIEADRIEIGKNVRFGENIDVKVRGIFRLGDFSRLGDDCEIRGNNVIFGEHFYNSKGLRVGGGGSGGENANLTVGERCVFHNNFINVCEPVLIGNDVGLSPEVSILTHGFWMSVLEGYPRKFDGVVISFGSIIGYRSTILPGVRIAFGCVIGAESVVTKHTDSFSIYAGNPAKFIRKIVEPTQEEKERMLEEILQGYDVDIEYPVVGFKWFWFDVNTFGYGGEETEETDRLRDYLRKYGIRIYTERPF